MNLERPITMHLTVAEAQVIAAAIYNGQISGKLKTHSGLSPSHTAELATDLFDRIRWLLDDAIPQDIKERFNP